MHLFMKQQLAWNEAYVLYYVVSCPTEAVTSFAPESCGRADGPNTIQVCCYFVIFGKHMQNASFPPLE